MEITSGQLQTGSNRKKSTPLEKMDLSYSIELVETLITIEEPVKAVVEEKEETEPKVSKTAKRRAKKAQQGLLQLLYPFLRDFRARETRQN